MKTKINIDNYLWCPFCKKLERVYFKAEVESNLPMKQITEDKIRNYFWKDCSVCKNSMVYMDIEIFRAIEVLNNKGYKTDFCCEGHSFGDHGYIVFSPSTPIPTDLEAPEHWFWDNLRDGFPKDTLRTFSTLASPEYYEKKGIKFEDYKKKYLDSLNAWVDELPPYQEPNKGGDKHE